MLLRLHQDSIFSGKTFCFSLFPLFIFIPPANMISSTDPKLLNQYGTCTASPATPRGWKKAGRCSRPPFEPRAPRLPTAPLTTSTARSRDSRTRWRASGSPRRSSTTTCSSRSRASLAWTSGCSTRRPILSRGPGVASLDTVYKGIEGERGNSFNETNEMDKGKQ